MASRLIVFQSTVSGEVRAITSNERRRSSVVPMPHEGDAPTPTIPTTVSPDRS